MSNSDIVAGEGSRNERAARAPSFQELNFKNWKKFFIAFLMRYDRAHLAIEEADPSEQISADEFATLSESEQKEWSKKINKWNTRNEVAYSYLMEVCNLHDKANTIAALYDGRSAAGLKKKNGGEISEC